jgi:hypothetical protein
MLLKRRVETNLHTPCNASSKNPESGKLQLDELAVASSPGRVINDHDGVLLQRDKSRRRSVERTCPILQSSKKRNRLASHTVFLARRSKRARVVQLPGSSVFLVSECPHLSFSFATDIGRLEVAHTPHKMRSWSTRSCNHERPSGFVIRSFGPRPTGATPLRSNFNPANCSLQEFFHRQEAMSAYFRTTRIVNQQHTRPRDHRIE